MLAFGSAQQILAEKDLNRTFRAFNFVDEVLHNRFLVQFKRWCDKNGKTIPDILLQDTVKVAETFSGSATVTTEQRESFISGINKVAFQGFQDLLQDFQQEGKATSSFGMTSTTEWYFHLNYLFLRQGLACGTWISMLKLRFSRSCLLQTDQYIQST